MKQNRNWTILLIGGPSGTGKSRLASELSCIYEVNVLELDDLVQAIQAVTTSDMLPALNYWSNGLDWKTVGVTGNVKWLIQASEEIRPALTAIIEHHLETDIPLIIEGDFLDPRFVATIINPKVRTMYLYEGDKDQIIRNYRD